MNESCACRPCLRPSAFPKVESTLGWPREHSRALSGWESAPSAGADPKSTNGLKAARGPASAVRRADRGQEKAKQRRHRIGLGTMRSLALNAA